MLAVAAKYASLLFVPSIVVLAGLAAVQKPGRKTLIAPVALGVTTAGLLAGVLYLAGPGLPDRHQVHDAEPVPGQQFRLFAALGLRAVDRRAVRAGRHRRGGVHLAAVH